MDPRRLERLRMGMRSAGIDAAFVSNPKNVQYLAGFKSMMPGEVQAFGDPEGFALVTNDTMFLLCDGRYIAGAKKLADGWQGASGSSGDGRKPRAGAAAHGRYVAEKIDSPTTAKTFAEKIKTLLPAGAKTLGIERDALLYGDAIDLIDLLGSIRCVPAEEILAGLRLKKSPEEVEAIRRAQRITHECFEHVAGILRLGMTERQVALEIDNYLRTSSEGNSFNPIVAFGETSCHPHYLPDPKRRLERGQLVLLDFGAIHDGYCGDMTRMICMGKPDARQREVYDMVLAAQERCLAGVRPGVTAHELDAMCRDYFAAKGCAEQFSHGTGHGVGLAIHEGPRIKKTFETRIEPGMVFTVEPGLYFEGWGGVRIEDMVFVTETGCENLTPTSKALRVVEG